ncbi:MAG TPA: glycosyltransferase family 39 protein [Phototrophicaceae bacterium]|jgi:hypothetical protein|nr:glycosyltransferase family 39 protein [Phototrophicaceae bacterium]
MLKNNRISFVIAVMILMMAAGMRFWHLTTLPAGFSQEEILDIRLADSAREGYIQVFYNLGGEGREGFYHTVLTAVTAVTGNGILGYNIFAAWLGMLTIALMYALARRLYGNLAGLGSMALLAFGFFPILLSRMVARETLLPLLTTAVMLTLALGLPVYWRRRGNQTQTSAFAALGLLLGIGFYVHPAGLLVALYGLLFVIYILFQRQHVTRQLLSYISFAALIALIVATPYLVSAIRLPELGGVTRLFQGFIGAPNAPIQRLMDGLLAIGLRGDPDPVYNIPGRPLFDPLSAVIILIGLVGGLRYFNKPRYALPVIALVALLPLALLSPDSPSFIAFATVLPVLALLFGLGIKVIIRLTNQPQAVLIGVTVLLLVSGAWTAYDLFGRWSAMPEVQTVYHTRLAQLAHRIDQTADDIPTVICQKAVSPDQPQIDLTSGQLISLMQHRRDADLRFVDCEHGLLFINGGGLQQVILTEPDALETTSPFVLDWLHRAAPLTGPNIPSDSIYVMEVASALADKVGAFTTTTLVQYPPESSLPGQQTVPPVRFGGNLTFLGYQLPDVDFYPPGGIITVTTYWRVDGVLPPDLTLFTHIIDDPAASPVANTDSISVSPDELHNRDVFMQVTYVPLSLGIPAGMYTVSTGAYQGGDKQRMDVLSATDDVSVANRLFLYGISVRPAG